MFYNLICGIHVIVTLTSQYIALVAMESLRVGGTALMYGLHVRANILDDLDSQRLIYCKNLVVALPYHTL